LLFYSYGSVAVTLSGDKKYNHGTVTLQCFGTAGWVLGMAFDP